MAFRLVQKGNKNKYNDHNKLINKNLSNQHPIESITSLREELDEKYVKPPNGIPPEDLSFNVVTEEDVIQITSSLEQKIISVQGQVDGNKVRIDILEDLLKQLKPDGDLDESVSDKFKFAQGFRDDYITTGGESEFHTSDTYIVGGQHLQVYRDGTLLQLGADYAEVSNIKIKLNDALEAGIIITLICPYSHKVISPLHEEILTQDGQVEFKIKNKINKGSNSLSVFVNGIRLENETHYEEVDSNTIRLLVSPFEAGTKIIFRQSSVSKEILVFEDEEFKQNPFVINHKIDTDGIFIVEFDEVYIPNSGAIDVFLNGMLQFKEFDYIENTEHSVEFLEPLDDGDVVRICSNLHINKWTYSYIIPNDTDVIELENPYVKGRDDLQVYENGILLFVDHDYEEVNSTTIKFKDILEIGTRIIIKKRR